MTIPLYFDRYGFGPAAKEFVVSLVKTMIAAGLAYAIKRLGDINTTTPELLGSIGLIRALLTSGIKYVATTATTLG